MFELKKGVGGRAAGYLEYFDSQIERFMDGFDVKTGLVRGVDPADFERDDWDWSIAALPREERKKFVDDPKYSWCYGVGRGSAALIGVFGQAYGLEGSAYHRDPRLLEYVKSGFETFLAHQDTTGEFIFCPVRFSTVYGAHEMSWRLIPLILAFKGVEDSLSPAERRRYFGMLRLGMDFLLASNYRSLSNRGCVWAGAMALSYRVAGDERYLEAAKERWGEVRRIFQPSGEVLEGQGPDHNYSPISFLYIFLYRVMSEDPSPDTTLMRSLDWFVKMYTDAGLPIEGMSTRGWMDSGKRLQYLLGALEYYAPRRPYYAALAGNILGVMRSEGIPILMGGWPILAAAAYYDPQVKAKPLPGRLRSYLDLFSSERSVYALVGKRNYRTAVVFKSRLPLKGLQVWAWNGRAPAIYPAEDAVSAVLFGGKSSAEIDMMLDNSFQVSRGDLDILTFYQMGLYTTWVFSPYSTVVIENRREGLELVRWAIGRELSGIAKLGRGAVVFEGEEFSIRFDPGRPCKLRMDGGRALLELGGGTGPLWTALTGGDFELTGPVLQDGDIVYFGFRDRSGSYRVYLNHSDEVKKIHISGIPENGPLTFPPKGGLFFRMGM